MLLRIGWAPVNADPLPSTPRWPLWDVVTRLDGSASNSFAQGNGADQRSNAPPRATFSTLKVPPLSSARCRRLASPLSVMSPHGECRARFGVKASMQRSSRL